MNDFEELFPGDRYDTPPGIKPAWLPRLLGRAYFYFDNFKTFLDTGKCARAGQLDQARQVEFSNRNIRLVERCGGRVHLRGLDHLRQLGGRPAVLMGNHMSLLETAIFHAVARGKLDFTFVIKESLLKLYGFGDIMRALDAIPVSRQNPREDFRTVMTLGAERLKRGKSIILFPQATRSATFNPENFNSIGIKLAKAADVPILPFVLKTDFLANGRLIKDLGPLRRDREIWMEFFPPVAVTGTGKNLHAELVGLTVQRLTEWYKLENRKFHVAPPPPNHDPKFANPEK